jgi:hypothetical protein
VAVDEELAGTCHARRRYTWFGRTWYVYTTSVGFEMREIRTKYIEMKEENQKESIDEPTRRRCDYLVVIVVSCPKTVRKQEPPRVRLKVDVALTLAG